MENPDIDGKKGSTKTNGILVVALVIGIVLVVAFLIISAINAMTGAPQPGSQHGNGLQNGQSSQNPTAQTNPGSGLTFTSGDVQTVLLSIQNYNYYPQRIVVKKDRPVKITADLNSISGCYRSFQIPDLGVKHVFTQDDPSVQFVPDRTGEFKFSCSMGMGTGVIVVE